MEKDLVELMKQFKWHWSLEKVSELGYCWCVYDTDTGDTLSYEKTPEEAIYNALNKPMTKEQQKYAPIYGWNLLFGKLPPTEEENNNEMD